MQSNQFAGTDIYLPENFKEYFRRYCLTRTEGSKNNPEDSPFPRMVDMWFLAMCLAVREGLAPVMDVKGATYKAIEGVVFGSDLWRSNAIMLIAIAHTGGIQVTANQNEMMRIANGFAIAGLPTLIARLEERGGDTALDYLSDEMLEILPTCFPSPGQES